jgi:hypothetical protein
LHVALKIAVATLFGANFELISLASAQTFSSQAAARGGTGAAALI